MALFSSRLDVINSSFHFHCREQHQAVKAYFQTLLPLKSPQMLRQLVRYAYYCDGKIGELDFM